jgi:PBP1b-binding outer membrane lipoprotein LpoB
MKKILILALFSGLFLTACGGGDAEKKTEDTAKTEKPEAEPKAEKDTAKANDSSAPVVEEVDEDITEDSLKTKKP